MWLCVGVWVRNVKTVIFFEATRPEEQRPISSNSRFGTIWQARIFYINEMQGWHTNKGDSTENNFSTPYPNVVRKRIKLPGTLWKK